MIGRPSGRPIFVRACHLCVLFGLAGSALGQPLDRTVWAPGAATITDSLPTLRKRLESDLTGMAAAQLLLSGRAGFTQLTDAFHSGGTIARRAAVWAAGVSDDPRGPDVVACGLIDRQFAVIDQARRAVWARPARYLKAVERQLHATPQAKRWSLHRVLSEMGEAGAQILAKELRAAKGPLRRRLADVLLDSPKSRDALAAELIRDQDAEVRRAAYAKLMYSSDKSRRQLLWKGLGDRDVTVRRLVSEAFRRLIAPSAVDRMIRASSDADADVRVNAAWGLGNLSYLDYALEAAPKGLAALFAMLDDKDPKVLAAVSERIVNYASLTARRAIALKEQEVPGSPQLSQLRDLLGRPGVRERLYRIMVGPRSPQAAQSAAWALACLGDRRALPSLLMQLEHPDETNVFPLAAGFAVLGDKSSTEPLLATIKATNDYFAGALLSAFEGIPDASAVPALLTILRDSQAEFQRRSAAGRALATIPDSAAHRAVIAFVRDTTVESMLRGNVLYGLAWMQTPEAHAALLDALRDPTISSRWQVVGALGLFGDPGDIPLLEPFLSDPNETTRDAAKTAVARLQRIQRAHLRE